MMIPPTVLATSRKHHPILSRVENRSSRSGNRINARIQKLPDPDGFSPRSHGGHREKEQELTLCSPCLCGGISRCGKSFHCREQCSARSNSASPTIDHL